MLPRFSAWVERAASRSCDRRAAEQRGQVAVLFAIAAVAIVVTAGLALDAGQSFVSQRALQAGADTAAQSGTSMLDADFTACVNSQALPYTASDISGVVTKIVSDAAAAQGGATSPPVATFVAYSSSPPALSSLGPVSSYTGQLCAPDGVWGGPTGVKVATTETRPTFVLQLLGIRTTTEDASGTAVFGYVGGAGAPFASWDAACYHSSSGLPLADGDTVVLLSPQWWMYTCGFGTPASFKGYIDPITPITLPMTTPPLCIQTGPGVGIKTPPALQVGQTYLIPEISSYTKGYCPGYNASNAGPYMLTYAGMVAVTVTSETTTTIVAVVTDTSPTTSGVTICPIGDASCSSSFGSTSPTGVELYQ